jgi:Transglycosylase
MPVAKPRPKRSKLRSWVMCAIKLSIAFLLLSIALVLPLRWIPPITDHHGFDLQEIQDAIEQRQAVYLNVAQFGARIFGVEAASQHFFGVPANQLSAEQCALLAAVLPGPEIYFVDRPSETVLRAQSWILQQMYQLGGVEYLNRLMPQERK